MYNSINFLHLYNTTNKISTISSFLPSLFAFSFLNFFMTFLSSALVNILSFSSMCCCPCVSSSSSSSFGISIYLSSSFSFLPSYHFIFFTPRVTFELVLFVVVEILIWTLIFSLKFHQK